MDSLFHQGGLYPWQIQQWEYFTKMIQMGQMPHAILITGETGIGKTAFAMHLCQYLLCQKNQSLSHPCGNCKTCMLVKAGTHPDYHSVTTDKDDGPIAVGDIRALIEKLHLTLHFNGYKVALIDAAERMNMNASNALLKTLEEPPSNTVIILISAAASQLSATIRSRCHTLQMHTPANQDALSWLQGQNSQGDWERLLLLAKGAPLQALHLIDTDLSDQRIMLVKEFLELAEFSSQPVARISQFDSISVTQMIEWVQGVILDIMRLKSAKEPVILENPDFYRALLALAPRLEVPLLLEFWDWLADRKKIFDISLNRRLFVEDIFITGHMLFRNA